nr:MAG TPA: hypothetical protein [Caudoviricetes sp.]
MKTINCTKSVVFIIQSRNIRLVDVCCLFKLINMEDNRKHIAN